MFGFGMITMNVCWPPPSGFLSSRITIEGFCLSEMSALELSHRGHSLSASAALRNCSSRDEAHRRDLIDVELTLLHG
jgi:hypothetical protein